VGATTEQIGKHIDATRADLATNLNELEQKVKSVIDWRHQYNKSPGLFLSAAVGGGLLLALATKGRRSARLPAPVIHADVPPRPPAPRGRNKDPQLEASIGEIKGALIGLATTRAKIVLSKLLPGFEAQLTDNGHAKPQAAGRARDATVDRDPACGTAG
jgi:hypothetical protein